mmetsp:Transcript_24335/g.48409  ORF Transcript_24335/g.48409 Transcript_24335/m.48409 type:complete len:255 (+) Transcript_24335:478-1242(+)
MAVCFPRWGRAQAETSSWLQAPIHVPSFHPVPPLRLYIQLLRCTFRSEAHTRPHKGVGTEEVVHLDAYFFLRHAVNTLGSFPPRPLVLEPLFVWCREGGPFARCQGEKGLQEDHAQGLRGPLYARGDLVERPSWRRGKPLQSDIIDLHDNSRVFCLLMFAGSLPIQPRLLDYSGSVPRADQKGHVEGAGQAQHCRTPHKIFHDGRVARILRVHHFPKILQALGNTSTIDNERRPHRLSCCNPHLPRQEALLQFG